MDKPSLDGFSYDCYQPLMGRDDVHFTSGVANHFFYMLSEGSGAKTIGGRAHDSTPCVGPAVSGIGRAAAAKIWYRALSVYMVPGTDYKDARDATLRAASAIYGAGSSTCAKVQKAWNAVSVTQGNYTCTGPVDPTTGPNGVRNASFEASPDGNLWKQASSGGGDPQVGAFGRPRTGSKHAWLRGYGATGTDSLTQSGVVVPSAGSPKLVYYLAIVSQEGTSTSVFDTFKVRIKPNGGSYTTVQNTANPKWDDSYHRMVVDLSAYAGQTVQLQFQATEDSSLATSFYVDDVSVR